MTTRQKMNNLLAAAASDGYTIGTRIEVERLTDYLLENGVTVLPKGAIILTRKEIAALNEYQKKHGAGGCS